MKSDTWFLVVQTRRTACLYKHRIKGSRIIRVCYFEIVCEKYIPQFSMHNITTQRKSSYWYVIRKCCSSRSASWKLPPNPVFASLLLYTCCRKTGCSCLPQIDDLMVDSVLYLVEVGFDYPGIRAIGIYIYITYRRVRTRTVCYVFFHQEE